MISIAYRFYLIAILLIAHVSHAMERDPFSPSFQHTCQYLEEKSQKDLKQWRFLGMSATETTITGWLIHESKILSLKIGDTLLLPEPIELQAITANAVTFSLNSACRTPYILTLASTPIRSSIR